MPKPGTRRGWIAASLFLLGAAMASPCFAQAAWPTKPVRLVVPYPPGGASDITARLLGQKLGELWGQPVIIDNRVGANGIIALEHVAKQPADGYTLLMANLGPNAINAAVYSKLPYDPIKDFTAITLTTLVPQVLVAGADLPQKSLRELLDYARANPGKVTYGTGGTGSSNHLGLELIGSLAGVSMVAVPYKGDGPAMIDTMSGQVSVSLPTVPAAMPNIKAGKLRALAVGGKTRVPSLPDVPTMHEAGVPGYESESWFTVAAPKGTPPALIAELAADLRKALSGPEAKARYDTMALTPVLNTPAQAQAFITAETAKWNRVIEEAKLQLD